MLKHLGDFLRDELADGKIDFHLRARIERRTIFGVEQNIVRFYIHPQNASGDTQDYYLTESEGAHLLFVDTLDGDASRSHSEHPQQETK